MRGHPFCLPAISGIYIISDTDLLANERGACSNEPLSQSNSSSLSITSRLQPREKLTYAPARIWSSSFSDHISPNPLCLNSNEYELPLVLLSFVTRLIR